MEILKLMCGIVGQIGYTDKSAMRSMLNCMVHRGPDDEGIFTDKERRISFGHRRLSILDLTSHGYQPMSYGDGIFWIVYNGEVYNHFELRNELMPFGYTFRSECDTETILAAYIHWGRDFVSRLRGMFAFAIYDSRSGYEKVLLVRDRFGIKPLYYISNSAGITFASEVKTLLSSRIINPEIAPKAIWDFLATGSVREPGTIIKNIYALEPASIYEISLEGKIVSKTKYWDLVNSSLTSFGKKEWNYQDTVKELRFYLEQTTRLHSIADVPVGAFLSGGIDSTAVVGLMSKQSSQPINTFSVGFELRDIPTSEHLIASRTAKKYDAKHHNIILTKESFGDQLNAYIKCMDQPSIDGANTWFVSKTASNHVKVALSGLGGDELFAGYPFFAKYAKNNEWIDLKSRIVDLLPFFKKRNKIFGRIRGYLQNGAQYYRTARSFLLPEEIHALWPDGFSCEFVEEQSAGEVMTDCDILQKVSLMEIKGYLRNTLLRDADVTSMAHSLEIRPILLDHKLAEFVFMMPANFKIRNNHNKAVFIDAVKDLLPSEIVNRKKTGFELPLNKWFKILKPSNSMALNEYHEIIKSFDKNVYNKFISSVPMFGWGMYLLNSNLCNKQQTNV